MLSVKPLLLSEVEELIYGYSVEKMMKKWVMNPSEHLWVKSLVKALVKDKLFTIEDIDNAYIQGANDVSLGGNRRKMREDYLKSLLPKTKWDIEFKDGKIKLV